MNDCQSPSVVLHDDADVLAIGVKYQVAWLCVVPENRIAIAVLEGIPKNGDEYEAEGLYEAVPCALGICGEPEPGGYFLYGIGCPRECVQHVPERFDIWTVPTRT